MMGNFQEKDAKNLTKMFKEAKGASKSASMLTEAFSAITPAGIAFKVLGGILKIFEPILKVIGSLFDVLGGSILKSVMPALKPFITLLLKLAPVFEVVGSAIGWFISGSLWVLLHVIYAIGLGIAYVVDFIAGILNFISFGLIPRTNAVGGWNDIMLPVLGSFATGTSYVPRTGPYMLHQGESVKTARENSLDEYRRLEALETTAKGITKLVALKEDRY